MRSIFAPFSAAVFFLQSAILLSACRSSSHIGAAPATESVHRRFAGMAMPPQSGCEFCHWLDSQSHAWGPDHPVNREAFCEDPYRTLSTPDLGKRSAALIEEFKQEKKRFRTNFFSIYAGEMGIDLAELLTEELRRHGIVVSDLSARDYFRALLAGEPGEGLQPSDIPRCADEQGAWSKLNLDSSATEAELKEYASRGIEFVNHWSAEIREFARRNPIVFLENVSQRCVSLKEDIAGKRFEESSEGARRHSEYLQSMVNLPACASLNYVASAAADILRREKIEWTQAEARRVVDPHLPLLMANFSTWAVESRDGQVSRKLLEAVLRQEKYSSTCSSLRTLIQAETDKVVEQFIDGVFRSKTYLTRFAETFYPSQLRGDKVHKGAFEWARQAIDEGYGLMVHDDKTLAELRARIENVELVWIDVDSLPFVDSVDWAGRRQTLIDETKLPANSTFWLLQPRLSSGGNFSATYLANANRVNVTPAAAWFFKKAPMSLIAVFAHEIGHAALRSSSPDFDVMATPFGDALLCLASNKAILLKKNQWNEAGADVTSALAVATLLSRLPREARLSAAAETMAFFLFAHDNTEKLASNDCHPFSPFRVSGIFGASTRWRESLGCGVSEKYKTCF